MMKTVAVLISPLVLSLVLANYVYYDAKISREKVIFHLTILYNKCEIFYAFYFYMF